MISYATLSLAFLYCLLGVIMIIVSKYFAPAFVLRETGISYINECAVKSMTKDVNLNQNIMLLDLNKVTTNLEKPLNQGLIEKLLPGLFSPFEAVQSAWFGDKRIFAEMDFYAFRDAANTVQYLCGYTFDDFVQGVEGFRLK